jgi:arginyl-tRNA synthetase
VSDESLRWFPRPDRFDSWQDRCAGPLAGKSRFGIAVEPPRDPAHGDLSTNAAMVYAREARSFFANPRQLAGTCDAI